MMSAQHTDRIAENWNSVCVDVADAITSAGRGQGEVRIVGVTKYVDAEMTAALVDAGCVDLGENRPQVLWEKSSSGLIDSSVRWHMIGHLQRNKVRRTLKQHPMIHSVDSTRLLNAVATESVAQSITTDVLLEINVSDEEAKTGMARSEVDSILEQDPPPGVQIVGLMAMAGWGTDSTSARKQFAAVRSYRDELRQRTGLALNELSMGMSGDFAEAIAEGATLVRIGSRLFQGVID